MRHAEPPQDSSVLSASQWHYHNRQLADSDEFLQWCERGCLPEKLPYEEWSAWYRTFARRRARSRN